MSPRAPSQHTPGEPCPSIMGHFPDLPETIHPLAVLADRAIERALQAPPPKNRGHDGEYGCRVPVGGMKRCPECWQEKAFPSDFNGRHNCNVCRAIKR